MADQAGVATFSVNIWLLMGGVVLAVVLGCLFALATLYRDQTALHDLKLRVHALRTEYAQRLADELVEVVAEDDQRQPDAVAGTIRASMQGSVQGSATSPPGAGVASAPQMRRHAA